MSDIEGGKRTKKEKNYKGNTARSLSFSFSLTFRQGLGQVCQGLVGEERRVAGVEGLREGRGGGGERSRREYKGGRGKGRKQEKERGGAQCSHFFFSLKWTTALLRLLFYVFSRRIVSIAALRVVLRGGWGFEDAEGGG